MQIPPPFIPEVRSPTDTHNYDPEFTTPVQITPPSNSQNSLIVIHEQDETFNVSIVTATFRIALLSFMSKMRPFL